MGSWIADLKARASGKGRDIFSSHRPVSIRLRDMGDSYGDGCIRREMGRFVKCYLYLGVLSHEVRGC